MKENLKNIILVAFFIVVFTLVFIPNSLATVTITSQSPPNLAERIDAHPYLNASIVPYSDVSLTINCTLYVDGNPNQTMNDITNNTEIYLNSSVLSNGDHTWYINCTDDNWATQTQSEIRTIGIGSSFSRCAVLIDSGNYNLSGNAIGSGDCIKMSNRNIVFNCLGYIVDGGTSCINTGSYNGITIENCNIQSCGYGIKMDDSNNCIIRNNNISSCCSYAGIFMSGKPDGNEIYNNRILLSNSGGQQAAIELSGVSFTTPNKIYNNILKVNGNGDFPVLFQNVFSNYWNTTYQPGSNIWNSSLGYIGGNLYSNIYTNDKCSDTCSDSNYDGFCDDPCVLAYGNIDYYPIAKTVGQNANTPPNIASTLSNPSSPSIYSHSQIYQFNATITDDDGSSDLATLIFNWNGTNYTHPYSNRQNSLVAYWKMNEYSSGNQDGNTVSDVSGNGNDGTIYGCNGTAGKFGNALSFDGVDDYVEVDDNLDDYTELTVSLWIKPALGSANEQPIWKDSKFGIYYQDFSTYHKIFLGFQDSISGTWKYSNNYYFSSGQYLNKWVHIVGVFGSNSIRLFVDGEEVVSPVTGTFSLASSTSNLRISGRGNGAYKFNGTIDEVMIFNRSLSADEIKRLYEDGYKYHNSTTNKYWFKLHDLAAGYYDYYWWVNDSYGAIDTQSGTYTINKALPSLNLYFDNTPSNYTITWLDSFEVIGNESNAIDDDVTYCLYGPSSLLGCGSSYNETYSSKVFSNASSPYKFVYNTSGGTNFTSNSKKLYLFVNKAWNQTDGIEANKKYKYDLNLEGIPIVAKKVSATALNSSIIVGSPLYATFNFSVNNTNNDTGLTITFTNVFANFTSLIDELWTNLSTMEHTYSSLVYNSPQYYTVSVKRVTVNATSISCLESIWSTFKKYHCVSNIIVSESDVSPDLPIVYKIPVSSLPSWSDRDPDVTNYFVDDKTSNTTKVETSDYVIITIGTSFSNSSLDLGTHTFELNYYIPLIGGSSSGGGGGGGASGGSVVVISINTTFEVFPKEITVFVSPGEKKLIAPFGSQHTFEVKNYGTEPIFVKPEIFGDYRDYVSFDSVTKMQTYQDATGSEYVPIDPGDSVGIDLYTNVPLDAKSGSYQIVVNFVDKETGGYETAKINLIVGGGFGSLAQKLKGVLLYSVEFSKGASPSVSREKVVLPSRVNASVPIGWLIIIAVMSISYLASLRFLKVRGRKIVANKYKNLLAVSISVIVMIIVFILLG